MTEETDRDLVERAESALSGLALREPDWEGLAQRIQSAVASAPAEDAALFEAPLPPTTDEAESSQSPAGAAPQAPKPADEGSPSITLGESTDELDDAWASAPEAAPDLAALADTPSRESARAGAERPASEAEGSPLEPPSRRDGVSLADLARASVARRGSAEVASIAKESLAVATQSRAQGNDVAERLQALAPGRAESAAPPPPSARHPGGARQAEVLRGPWIGVAVAAIGLAAGFLLYLRGQQNEAVPVVMVEAPAPRAAEPAEARRPAPASTPKSETPPAEPPLPAEELAEARPAQNLPRQGLDQSAAPKEPGGSAKPQAASTPGKVKAERIVLEEEPGAAPKPPASAAPNPADAKLRPAELSSETMTDRPSAGAAQAAVGAVLGAARSCIAGHPQPSTAELVFGSDGRVHTVRVGGPAAGTPASGCIEAALKKARVQPFAASSFSLGVTVRPPP